MTKLRIVGHRATTVRAEHTVTIELGAEFELQIEGDLTLPTADGAVLHATSDDYASISSELETLVSAAVTRADADEISGLTLEFDSGARLHVPVDQHYEAWGVVGPGGYRVICMPGGEFAIWSACK
ncbi:DUF6188 family protein [Nocardia otitidiscaviarum]|uniref:DUF6188 family protein n=1 Tax=Nocardia otitidiscaviarum TaxID=1823 RepID=UPI0020D19E37|nr:DUF6188 family protein [Nocardia otitidiscaviarum]